MEVLHPEFETQIGCSRESPKMKKSIMVVVCVCLGLLSSFLSASFVLASSQGALLSKPPKHGTAFIISFESKDLPGETNALAKLEAAVTERFSKLGAQFYWEPISPTRVRVITPVQDPRDAELFRQSISRGTTME
ncbi:MAG: Preprotein translocase subunit SecD, partial [Pedosphaera sp.]|nr:Preprotein translocase subunit SecD [Pedosphaera sp.]